MVGLASYSAICRVGFDLGQVGGSNEARWTQPEPNPSIN